jgi:hypothetical protein
LLCSVIIADGGCHVIELFERDCCGQLFPDTLLSFFSYSSGVL